MRDELITSADDNEHTPESLIPLYNQFTNTIIKKERKRVNTKCNVKTSVNEVRDELTFSPSDNDDNPESPILFLSAQ